MEQRAAYVYSAIVTIFPGYFPFTAVYFETAAIIITLILMGRLLETKTKEKASGAVRKLVDLKPGTAHVLRPAIEEKNNASRDDTSIGEKPNGNRDGIIKAINLWMVLD